MMIVQKHKHIDGSVSYLKFKNGGYDMTVELYNPMTQDTVYLHRDRAIRYETGNSWMKSRRKIW